MKANEAEPLSLGSRREGTQPREQPPLRLLCFLNLKFTHSEVSAFNSHTHCWANSSLITFFNRSLYQIHLCAEHSSFLFELPSSSFMRYPWIKDDSMVGSQTFQSLNHDVSSYVLPGFLLIFHSFIPLISGSMCQSPGLQSGAGQWEGMGFKGNSVCVKADKSCTKQPINWRTALKLHSVIIGFLDTSYLLLHYFMSCFS